MIANYHTHTTRCRHAVGMEEDYVNCAIESGLQILGFSDHTPYWFPGEYYSTFRMFPDQLEDYCRTVMDLKARYADKLEIHLGLEVEYYPAYFGELLAHLNDTPMEYMLLGQHYVGNEIGEHYSGNPTDKEEILAKYCDQLIEAMQTGLFTYLAHPDLLHYEGDQGIYRKHMRRVCQEAKACGIPLEINFVGIRGNRHYPNDRFWELAAEEGCKTVFGCDAHGAGAAYDKASEQVALQLADRFGLEVLQTVPLRPIR